MDRLTVIVTLVTINAALSRALREDFRFFPNLRAPYRDLVLAAATLIIAPALDTVTQGTAIGAAFLTAGAAALPTLIKLVLGIFATPQSAGQVAAQAQANRLAKLPPVACLLICLAAVALFASGCAGSLTQAKAEGAPFRATMAMTPTTVTPDGVDCQSLDQGHVVWHGAGLAFDFLGGAAGVTSAALPSDKETTRRAFILTAVGFAAAGIASEAIATGLGNEWARYCSGP